VHVDVAGPAGRLEALLEPPLQPRFAGQWKSGDKGPESARFAAVVCHPHPAMGGTMHNHATYRLAKAVTARGGVALRFNFRGVGRSAGRYDAGRGEEDDARAAVSWLAAARPGVPLLGCGFSFGAWMTALACGGDPRVAGLLLAGVAVRAPGLEDFRRTGRIRDLEKPVAVIQASDDELGPPAEIEEALTGSRGPRRFAVVPGATHLFVEALPALQREAEAALDWLLAPPAGGTP
jgi:alpha/beta superfamily hydrolase